MFRVAGINFDHMHMGDLLRQVHDHPGAEISGICDADRGRMAGAIAAFGIHPQRCSPRSRPVWPPDPTWSSCAPPPPPMPPVSSRWQAIPD